MINLNNIKVEDLATAYEGIANRCTCGCKGNHYANSILATDIEKAEALIAKFAKLAKQGNANLEIEGKIFKYQTSSKLFILELK